MAYSRIREDYPKEDAINAKAKFVIWPLRSEHRLLSYEKLSIAVIFLLATTSAVLGWVVFRRLDAYGNHSVNQLPFPSGMD
jgi:hypothetical protein